MKKEFTPGHFFMNRSLICGREAEVGGSGLQGPRVGGHCGSNGCLRGWGCHPWRPHRVQWSHGRTLCLATLTFVQKKRIPVRRVMISPARRR